MFSTRVDQENLVYNHQAAAAAKPLNQTKTPGNKAPKTPFRANRNDENNAFLRGKSAFKETKGKDFVKPDAFVTPAGPRTRAPLGAKTTNAKGLALQTPGAFTNAGHSAKNSQKPVSPRLRKAKVKIHRAEVVPVDAHDEEPEIEYMPPRSQPLPDYPDDLHTLDYDKIFNREQMLSGMIRHHTPLTDENGKTESDRRVERESEEANERIDRQIMDSLNQDPLFRMLSPEPDLRPMSKSTSTHSKQPITLSSRAAAGSLAKPSRSTPTFAAPTVSTASRHPTSAAPAASLSSRKAAATASLNPTTKSSGRENPAHLAAAATSRSTLGYSKGRAISASTRKPLSAAHRAEVVKGRPTVSQGGDREVAVLSQEEERERATERFIAEQEESDRQLLLQNLFGGDQMGTEGTDLDGTQALAGDIGRLDLGAEGEDDELADFQLQMPEDV